MTVGGGEWCWFQESSEDRGKYLYIIYWSWCARFAVCFQRGINSLILIDIERSKKFVLRQIICHSTNDLSINKFDDL